MLTRAVDTLELEYPQQSEIRFLSLAKGEYPLLVVCGQLTGLSGEGVRKALLAAQESTRACTSTEF